MIDMSIVFTISWVFSLSYCTYKVIKLKKAGKGIKMTILIGIVFPESLLVYDFIRKGLPLLQKYRSGVGKID